MKFISYDELTKNSTIEIDDDELLDLLSVLDGVLNTFDDQDSTLLGVKENRLQEVHDRLATVLHKRG